MTTRTYMLPGSVLQEPGARRTARDWIVDATMLLVALAVSSLTLAGSLEQHSEDMVFVDVVIGVAALVPLWGRGEHPFAVALLTIVPGAVSAFAAGAGLFGLFNVALRGSRRAIVISTVVALAGGVAFALLYPPEDLVLELVL